MKARPNDRLAENGPGSPWHSPRALTEALGLALAVCSAASRFASARHEIVEMFRSRLGRAKDAIARGRDHALVIFREAHALSSLAGNLGFMELMASCRLLMQAARQERTDGTALSVTALQEAALRALDQRGNRYRWQSAGRTSDDLINDLTDIAGQLYCDPSAREAFADAMARHGVIPISKPASSGPQAALEAFVRDSSGGRLVRPIGGA